MAYFGGFLALNFKFYSVGKSSKNTPGMHGDGREEDRYVLESVCLFITDGLVAECINGCGNFCSILQWSVPSVL